MISVGLDPTRSDRRRGLEKPLGLGIDGHHYAKHRHPMGEIGGSSRVDPAR
jgi:hypothetical protein